MAVIPNDLTPKAPPFGMKLLCGFGKRFIDRTFANFIRENDFAPFAQKVVNTASKNSPTEKDDNQLPIKMVEQRVDFILSGLPILGIKSDAQKTD